MLALLTADSTSAEQSTTIEVLVAALREHETVLVVGGVDAGRQLLREVHARMPRLRCLPLLAEPTIGPDLELITDLLDTGAVPMVVVPDGATELVIQILAARLNPDSIGCLTNDGTQAKRAGSDPALTARAPQRGGRRVPVAEGWCTRPARQPCPHTAAEGCATCPDLQLGAAEGLIASLSSTEI